MRLVDPDNALAVSLQTEHCLDPMPRVVKIAGVELSGYSSAGDSFGRVSSSSPRKSTTSLMTWANTYLAPRATTGTERAPRARSSAIWASPSSTLMDSNSIPRTER